MRRILALLLTGCLQLPSGVLAAQLQGHGKLHVALCEWVGSGEYDLESNDQQVIYLYHSLIFQEAGVLPSDDVETRAKKIRKLWDSEIQNVYCSNTSYVGGSVIRYAVSRKIDPFIHDVTEQWIIPASILNKPDRKDGGTIIDYIDDELSVARTDAIKQRLERYKASLKSIGAKNRIEVDGIECRQAGGFATDSRCQTAR